MQSSCISHFIKLRFVHTNVANVQPSLLSMKVQFLLSFRLSQLRFLSICFTFRLYKNAYVTILLSTIKGPELIPEEDSPTNVFLVLVALQRWGGGIIATKCCQVLFFPSLSNCDGRGGSCATSSFLRDLKKGQRSAPLERWLAWLMLILFQHN